MSNLNHILQKMIQIQDQIITKLNTVNVGGAGMTSLPSSVTQMGNQFNGPQQLIKTNAEGKIPANLLYDYTAFEVYATNSVIPSGTSTGQFDGDTQLIYNYEVPAGMEHHLVIRTDTLSSNITQNDVYVDWGDGSVDYISGITDISQISSKDADVGETDYTLKHTYTEEGKYKVCIYGSMYWGMNSSKSGYNLICRVFDWDLPIAKHLVNMSSFCANAQKLLRVCIPTGLDLFTKVTNASSIFNGCTNLLIAKNFSTKFVLTRYVSNMFNNCKSLIYSDFRLSQSCIKASAYGSVYKGCQKLAVDINTLLPQRGFDGKQLNIANAFNGCASLKGTIPARILWNDMAISWTATNCFANSSLSAQAPASWGGPSTNEIESPYPITRTQAKALIQQNVAIALEDLDLSTNGSGGTGIAAGTGNVLGGYAALIDSVEGNLVTLKQTDQLDMTKFTPGTSAVFNATYPDVTDQQGQLLEYGKFIKAEIIAVIPESGALQFNQVDISGCNTATALRVYSSDTQLDSRISLGDYNFIIGGCSVANGTMNAILGYGSTIWGSMSTVGGDMSNAMGVNTHIDSDSTTVIGSGNKALSGSDMSVIIGSGCQAKSQSQIIIGSSKNDGLNSISIGSSMSGTYGYGAIGIGQNIVPNGKYSVAIGSKININAKGAVGLGAGFTLEDSPENEYAVAFGGNRQEGNVAFIIRSNKNIDNPQYDASTDTGTGIDSNNNKKYISETAYRSQYKGQLTAITDTINIIESNAIIYLNADMYSRWILKSEISTSVTPALQNWIDGDKGQIIVDTTNITLNIDSSWVLNQEINKTGLYVIVIEKVLDTIFASVKYFKEN